MTKISLNQQIDEIQRDLAERRSTYPAMVATRKLKQSQADFQCARLDAAWQSLTWLREHEAEIRAFMALPAADRAVVLSHGPLVAQMAAELARREAIAKAGGPVR